jgi:methyl-accepting chemotaxis protein
VILSLGRRFKRFRSSLGFRFSIFVGVGLIVVSAASGFVGIRAERATLTAELERQARQLADLLAASSANALFTFDSHGLDAVAQTFTRDAAVRHLEIRDKAGAVMKSTGEKPDSSRMILAVSEARAGNEVVGRVTLGLSGAPIEKAMAAAWGTTLVREALALLVLFLLLTYLVRKDIVSRVNHAVRVAEAVAAGDLSAPIESGSADEVGRLLIALKKMQDDLAESVSAIQVASEYVSTGAGEIARGNADLSSRTEEQASTLEQAASSMEDLTTTVKQNAENARRADELARGASGVAVRGGEVVREVVLKMSGISEASKKIGDIIGVIDGIAFQTNILALNAAVEAARAGEQGRGFAVVASEVRALAQRSAAAAKEIKGLIENSVQRATDGTKLVENAGETMAEIVASAKRVTEVVSEIAAASHEQLSGIEQLSQAVTQMGRVVQQNAALVEESAAAAENVAGQAKTLVQAVAKFKLEGDRRSAAERQPAAVRLERPRATAGTASLPLVPAAAAARVTALGRQQTPSSARVNS